MKIDGHVWNANNARECVLGDIVEFLPAPRAIVFRPEGSTVEASATFMPDRHGWFIFRFEDGDEVRLLAFERDVLERIPPRPNGRGDTAAPPDARRLVLRSLANHAALRGGEWDEVRQRSLNNYGW
jgi:hypothetical protein